MPFERTNSLQKIIAVLSNEPEGLWIREIARRTNLKSATVTYFVNRHHDLFEEQNVESGERKFFRIVRLKAGVFTKKGVLLSKILKEHEE